ncbi:site-specific integrase [Tamilnaduibacter salinus]|uniref:site-specific integrase n=1 Tax=Tamilnaduibacter salinus TaxID=1484056 RepID=UPI00130471C4|nr:site-specific integrase [Tamilnaduibacter salinus]
MSLSHNQIKALVKNWITRELEEFENDLLSAGAMSRDDFIDALDNQGNFLIEARERLGYRDTARAREKATEALRAEGMDTSHSAEPQVLNAFLHGEVELCELSEKLLRSGTTDGEIKRVTSSSAQAFDTEPTKEPTGSHMLSELISQFMDEQRAELRDKTIREYETSLDVLNELWEFGPVTSVSRDAAIRLRDSLLDYPLNRRKGRNSGLSLEEIKKQDWKPISKTTANKHYTRWSHFMSWCVECEIIDKNHLQGKAPKASRSTRRSWEPEELSKLFKHLCSHTYRDDQSWKYWLPILGLATGARIEELCGIESNDVKTDGSSHWYLDIVDSEVRRLKNETSIRKVPLHEQVIGLGFLEFVRTREGGLLFPELERYSSDSLSHEPSKWFGRLKSNLGFGKELVFHSFRHLVRELLHEASTPDSCIKEILGHDQNDVTFGTYGKIKPSTLKGHIDALPLEPYLASMRSYQSRS